MRLLSRFTAMASLLLFVSMTAETNAAMPDCYQELVSSNGALTVDLNVSLQTSLDGLRYSPLYNGCVMGPSIRVKPGDTLTVNLHNQLPPGSAVDRELYAYTHDEASDPVNMTIIVNGLSLIGNQGQPAFGYYGFSYMNLHFHGAFFPGSIENVGEAVDGGETRTMVFEIPSDRPPGLFWYHNHFHGTSSYSLLSGLYGFLVVEGTEYDITNIPELIATNATEQFMVLSEFMGNENGTPFRDPPIVMAFDWKHLTNGQIGDNYTLEYNVGDVVLFRMVHAGVEPTMTLSLEGHDFTVLTSDSIVLPEPIATNTLAIAGGQRVEFLVQFDTPGTFIWSRAPWNINITGVDACNATFGIPAPNCISWDVERIIARVVVSEQGIANNEAIVPTLPQLPPVYQELAEMEPVRERIVTLKFMGSFPLFQIPYDGPFVPPGVGFGIDDRIFAPYHYHGEIVAGTCETWHVVSDPPPPSMDHTFHSHAAPFMVTHAGGVEVENRFWEDTARIDSSNVTIHICFDKLNPGDYQMIHCHQTSHQDTGMVAMYKIVDSLQEGEASNSTEPSISGTDSPTDPATEGGNSAEPPTSETEPTTQPPTGGGTNKPTKSPTKPLATSRAVRLRDACSTHHRTLAMVGIIMLLGTIV